MNKELIERLRIYAADQESDSQDMTEAADALEAADKRIEELEAERDALLGKTQEWSVIHGDWSDKSQDADWLRLRYFDAIARIEHLEADNAVHDSEAKLANERIEQLEGAGRCNHDDITLRFDLDEYECLKCGKVLYDGPSVSATEKNDEEI